LTISFDSFRACGSVTKPENSQKQSKNLKFGFKTNISKCLQGGIHSGVGSRLNGTKVNALAILFGPSRDSRGVTKLENRQKWQKYPENWV
jgi:hypothetical protein